MSSFVDFFIEPYMESSTINIALEVIAVFLGILSVVLAQRAHIGVYPTGIISTSIYVYLTFITALYGEFIINIYHTAMSFYGWHKWKTKNISDKGLAINFSSRKDYFQTALHWSITFLFTIGIYYIFGKIHYTYAWADIFATAIFFAGMYQMASKKVENWLFWIVGNIISIPLYFIKGLPFTSIQFIIFTCLAIRGYCVWKKIAKTTTLNV